MRRRDPSSTSRTSSATASTIAAGPRGVAIARRPSKPSDPSNAATRVLVAPMSTPIDATATFPDTAPGDADPEIGAPVTPSPPPPSDPP